MKYDPDLERVLWRCAVWLALIIAFFLIGCAASRAVMESPDPAPPYYDGFSKPLPQPATTEEPAALLFGYDYNAPWMTPNE